MPEVTFSVTMVVPSVAEAIEAMCPDDDEPKTAAQAKANLGDYITGRI